MSTLPPLTIERIDDLPLLLAQLQRMGLQEVLDQHLPAHGNWHGLSLGWVVTIWLCHILSEGDHRLNHVEPWVISHLETLRRCIGPGADRLDVADDHLAGVLRTFGSDDYCDGC